MSVILSQNLKTFNKHLTQGIGGKTGHTYSHIFANFSSTKSLNTDMGDLDKAMKYWESGWQRKLDDNSNLKFHNQKQQGNDVKDVSPCLTHTDGSGKATMVDVGDKINSDRVAIATATILLGPEAFKLVTENKIKKGDVLTVAQLAGIMAGKKTSDMIPLCHNIVLSKVDVLLELEEENHSVKVQAMARTYGKTGVEMEAIMAATVSAMTVYDMCKAVTRDMVITDVKLLHKSGGHSDQFSR